MNDWILITSEHSEKTWILPEGDWFTYEVAPNNNLRKGDRVYLWSNPHNSFFGWGIVAETPQDLIVERPRLDNRLDKIKRMLVVVNRQGEFRPFITAWDMYQDQNLKKFIPMGHDDLYVLPLRPGQAHYLNDYIREHNRPAPPGSAYVSWLAQPGAPEITIQAIITPAPILIPGDDQAILKLGAKTNEGRLVEAVRLPWYELIRRFKDNPEEIYNIDPQVLEELVAGAYDKQGYKVELTPRSGDRGRDVVATKEEGSIRIFDQVKRYRVSRPVTADEVRALVGVLTMAGNVSKGVITTTSTFAPRLLDDEDIRRLVPYRLELKERDAFAEVVAASGKILKVDLPKRTSR